VQLRLSQTSAKFKHPPPRVCVKVLGVRAGKE
jgi:hypothetical protein